ncbi:unnamed protein product [Diatraea saccharalis]|uniref:Uncharacterized protein n=1 Tax=Diatraea saccharalis TaxID=40085 RepID=A0A9N9WFC3_9NEOP|nr:unnamed protein product [Diatraea saccharalis]
MQPLRYTTRKDCQKTTLENPPRSVNIALETVFAFNENDKSADIKLIDQVQEFLKSIKHVIRKNEIFRRSKNDNSDDTPLTFTDFVKSIMIILSSYNEDDLEDVAAVIDEELRKYHYKGCKFYELIENREVRRFMADKLDKIRTKPGNVLKGQLKAAIKKLTNENHAMKYKEIGEYVDSLYKKGDTVKFNSFLKKIALYGRKTKRANLDLTKIIRRGLRNLIFDHYSKLDKDTRRDLKIKLETFWNNFNGIELQHDVWKFESPTKSYKHKHSIKKKVVTNSVEVESVPSVTNKRIKKRKSLKNSMKISDVDKKKVSRTPRFTFITLYPEAITFVTQHRHGNKTSRKEHKKHSRTKPIEHKLVTKFRTHDDFIANKRQRVIFRSNYTINVEHLKSKSNKRVNIRANKNMRVYSKLRRIITARKSIVDSKIMDDSTEGLAIEAFDNIDGRKLIYRKSINANDTDILSTTVTPIENKTEPGINSDVVKRIKNLETELNAVKERIKINIDSTTKPPDTTHYDILEFWEGPSTVSKANKANKTRSHISFSTKTIKTTKKQITKKKSTVKKNITTLTTTTESVKPKPKTNFRSNILDHELEFNEILPITTTKSTKRTTRYLDRVELKTYSSQTTNSTTDDIVTRNEANNATTKAIDKVTTHTTAYEKKTPDFEIETYLNDTKLLDDDIKSQMVKQKMEDDLEKLIPNLKVETWGTTNDGLSVDKIATKDALAIMDEDDMV